MSEQSESMKKLANMDLFYAVTRMVLAMPEDNNALQTYYKLQRQVSRDYFVHEISIFFLTHSTVWIYPKWIIFISFRYEFDFYQVFQ